MMRQYIVIVTVFAVLLLATPAVFGAASDTDKDSPEDGSTVEMAALSFPKSVSLLLSESGETIELSIKDYLVGCLFAQIPLNYHREALNAQAVAAHTYLLRLMSENEAISDDPETCQPFFTEERARKHYNEEYDSYLQAIQAAAEYGSKRVIVYDNEPIYAVYHSISAGVTNTAHTVWGRDFPYLQSVESSWDKEHPDYLCTNEMTTESIRLLMYDYNKTASMPVDYSRWFVNPIKNDFGYVLSLKVGETLLSGGDMWRIFNLRSTSFEISFVNQGVFSIETRGFGHGAGLSQYGANVLGGRGFSCDEILKYYYTDVEIVTV